MAVTVGDPGRCCRCHKREAAHAGAAHPFDPDVAEAPEDDTRMRFRVYVDGALRTEDWVDARSRDGESRLRIHPALVLEATEAGQLWYAEVYDPALPPSIAYVRFGSDEVRMMVAGTGPMPGRPR